MTKWVKVMHRSPDTERQVLLYTDRGHMAFGVYDKDSQQYFFDGGRIAQPDEIAWWAERPLTPR